MCKVWGKILEWQGCDFVFWGGVDLGIMGEGVGV